MTYMDSTVRSLPAASACSRACRSRRMKSSPPLVTKQLDRPVISGLMLLPHGGGTLRPSMPQTTFDAARPASPCSTSPSPYSALLTRLRRRRPPYRSFIRLGNLLPHLLSSSRKQTVEKNACKKLAAPTWYQQSPTRNPTMLTKPPHPERNAGHNQHVAACTHIIY